MEIAVTGSSDDDELADARWARAWRQLVVRSRSSRVASATASDSGRVVSSTMTMTPRTSRSSCWCGCTSGSHEFEGRSRFGSWLYRITRNVALERRRVEARRSALLARELRPQTTVPHRKRQMSEAADAARIRGARCDAFRRAVAKTARGVRVGRAVAALSATEVAARLGIEASTVRVLLLRARRTIRARILAQHPDLLEEFRS